MSSVTVRVSAGASDTRVNPLSSFTGGVTLENRPRM
jgi:hypothetical protein